MIRLFLVSAWLLAGCVCTAPRPEARCVRTAPLPEPPTPAVSPHDNLNAVLWTQSAVEYRALAVQTFRRASAMLDLALADTSWTAALEQMDRSGYEDLPPAVVLDVDETVLDNSPYAARMVRDGVGYSDASWKAWVEEATAAPIPGALDFTRAAAARGVQVIYLTNRDADTEAATRANLARLGFPLTDNPDDVITQGEIPEWKPSDKAPRRAYVAGRHRILLLIGDNLVDFLSDNRADLAGRTALYARHEARWGRSWIVLPNPQYGSWESTTYGRNYDLSHVERRSAKRALLRTD